MMHKTKPPVKVRAQVRLKAYSVIADAIAGSGLTAIRRTFKHRDDEPSDSVSEVLAESLEAEVMSRLCEVLDFGDGDV
jgi:hypothetical protein